MDVKLTGPSSADAALYAEIQAQQKHEANQTHLGHMVSRVTDFLHGRSSQLNSLEILAARANVLREAGAGTDGLKAEIDKAVKNSAGSRARDEEYSTYGTGMLRSGALFFPGWQGRVAATVLTAADSAKRGDDAFTQGLDMGMGGARGLAQKLAVEKIGDWKDGNVAVKAVLTGMAFRGSETLLSRKAWLNKEGDVDPLLAAGRTIWSTVDPKSFGHDLIVFGTAHYALGNLKRYGSDLLRNPLSANVVAASCFGLSSGTFNELKRSKEQLVPFDPKRAVIQAALDGVASLPGGFRARQLQVREATLQQALQPEIAAKLELSVTAAVPELFTRVVEPGTPKAPLFETMAPAAPRRTMGVAEAGRQFVVVGGEQHLAQFMEGGKPQAVLQVREVHPNGTGDKKTLLVQHLEPGQSMAPAAKSVDLIATCNPQLLTGTDLRGRHIFPEVSGPVMLTEHGPLLTFSGVGSRFNTGLPVRFEAPPGPAVPGAPRVISLDRPLPELLLDIPRHSRYWDLHNLFDFASAAKAIPYRGKRIMGGGADSMVIELVDGRVLKLTDRPFDPTWGSRTWYDHTTGRNYPFDAKLLSEPKVAGRDVPITWYLQERVKMPISLPHLELLQARIDLTGKYVFWDMEIGPHGQSQAGYSILPGGRRRPVIADYDSVRRPEDVPETPSGPQMLIRTPWD